MTKKYYCILLGLLLPVMLFSQRKYDIKEIYKEVKINQKMVSLDFTGAHEVKQLLVEDEIEPGLYEVYLEDEEDHFFHILKSDYYIKIPYCYNICRSEKALLKINNGFFYHKGFIVWWDELEDKLEDDDVDERLMNDLKKTRVRKLK